MREQLQIDADVSDSDDDSSGGGADPEVRVFQAGTLTSTVTVAPIAVGSDSEDEKDLDGDSDDGGKPPAKSAAPNRKTAASKRPQHSSATQLSKCSLKIMAKTRMKLEGKTKGGGSWKSKSKVQDGKAEDGGRRGKRKGRR